VLIPLQLYFGHLTGLYVLQHQPAKFAAIEARWHPEQPGTEVWFAWPDEKEQRNLFAIETPGVGSLIATGSWTAPVQGLSSFPEEDRPPVVIPFFGFRAMAGIGFLMLGISWFGSLLRWRGRLETTRWFLWATFLSFPSGFVAIVAGWYTAEVGRQPWVVYGLLRTKDAVTPALKTPDVLVSLGIYGLVYALLMSFGVWNIYKLLRDGPTGAVAVIPGTTPSRPLAYGDDTAGATGATLRE
jgi:cytochrome bd ubiquinol oxidase subunit I